MAAESKLEALARERGKTPLAVLAEEYAKWGSQHKVAAALGVAPSTVRYWLLCHGIREKTVLVLDNTGFQLSPEGKQMLRSGS